MAVAKAESEAEAEASLVRALVGVPAADERKLADQLDSVLRHALWRPDPPSADVTSFAYRMSAIALMRGEAEPPDSADEVRRLAAAWRTAYSRIADGQVVLRAAVANPDDATRLAEAAARAGADIAVHIDRPTGWASWSWPLRLGVTAHDPMLSELRASFPELTDVVVLDGLSDAVVDLLFASSSAADELAGRDVRAGIVVTDAAELAEPHRLSRLFHAFGTLFVPDREGGGWWKDVLRQLSHDAPLDVAVRHVPGAVLVASSQALGLTAMRTYVAWLLRQGPDTPGIYPPRQLEAVLGAVPFDLEEHGGRAVADLLRVTGRPMQVTVGFTMAALVEPPDLGSGSAGVIDEEVIDEDAIDEDAIDEDATYEEATYEEAIYEDDEEVIYDDEIDEDEIDEEAIYDDEIDEDEIDEEAIDADEIELEEQDAADQEEEPRRAWPRVDAPDEVLAGNTFTVRIGLRRDVDPAVQFISTGALPAADDVGVTLVVDGFQLERGELEFTVNLARTATREVTLRAVDDPKLRAERTIGVRFTVGGAIRAYAMRAVLVRGAAPAPVGTLETVPPGPSSSTPIATSDPATPTLVLTLQQGADLAGHDWQWTITSDKVTLPTATPEQLRTTLDDTARDFQAKMVREGSISSGTQLYDRLLATGRHLSDKMPDAVIAALRAAVAAAAPHLPSVLLLSSEARIPWELAVIEPALTDAPSPFLCAQVNIGRWVIGVRNRPPVPPMSAKPVASRAVVVGDYSGLSTWNVLPQAATETAALVGQGAQQLPAEYQTVRDAVHGDPPVDVLHFATHGRFLEGQREEGLVLVDRSGKRPAEVYFTPDDVEAGDLMQSGPLVFLNSCQVGAAETVLGDYAGMAAAFLRIGATAVIAPLWEVDDTLAAVAATDFYAAVPTTTVGAAISALRGKFTAAAAANDETAHYGSFLAYQYFGHPNLSLAEGTP
jgi:CHAT domain-containing protein